MSKIPDQTVREAISTIVAHAKAANRPFVETVELQVTLKGIDPKKDKRFSGSIQLPNNPRPKGAICIIADAHHMEEAAKLGIDCIDMDGLAKFNKDKKLIKKFAKKYDAFIATNTLIRRIPRVLGPGLARAGKNPIAVAHGADLMAQVTSLQSTVKFQLKKVICLNLAVGNVAMTEDEIHHNLVLSINFLVSLLKKGWQNLKCIYIKTTQSPSVRIL
eukprot:gnl/Ergobibamus_cyprinoides/2344.p2 GENE.gnl/Ergobibamus_cyprinoides/2344~~gnl/Ergobibamus_cyprinoides/2344.p2  ORF type:complete len:217 (+),score=122.36 gnl/Ergobibamus_cyprinoides/2344:21-671(+)